MELWALLEMAFAFATAAGCFVLMIGDLYMTERAEQQEWWGQLKEQISGIR